MVCVMGCRGVEGKGKGSGGDMRGVSARLHLYRIGQFGAHHLSLENMDAIDFISEHYSKVEHSLGYLDDMA